MIGSFFIDDSLGYFQDLSVYLFKFEHRSNSKIPFYSILLVFNLAYYDKVCDSIVYKVFFIDHLSAVSTKSPTVNISSKATALLQRVSNLKRGCK